MVRLVTQLLCDLKNARARRRRNGRRLRLIQDKRHRGLRNTGRERDILLRGAGWRLLVAPLPPLRPRC
ncbi:hypothetical protein CDS [Bradyrhizobium sp.]|nr:hypothetical protein CDS [Bradyrhizobium sp.]